MELVTKNGKPALGLQDTTDFFRWQTHSEATDGLGYFNALHLYAEGIGGWSFAQAFMHEQFAMNIRTVAAVDNEHTAMKYWCRNHKAIFLHELMDIPRLLDTTRRLEFLLMLLPALLLTSSLIPV